MILTIFYDSTFLYPLSVLQLLYTHSVVTLSIHEVGSTLLHDFLAQTIEKFPNFMESKGLQELTTEIFHFYFTCSIFNDAVRD